jgi:hypothetical protein
MVPRDRTRTCDLPFSGGMLYQLALPRCGLSYLGGDVLILIHKIFLVKLKRRFFSLKIR